MTTKLCKQLGLKVLPYDGTYALANGAKEKYAGKLGREMLQLHDKLLLEVDNIRVMEANYIGAILGTDILGDNGALVRTANTGRDGDTTYLTLEVGVKGSGVLFQVPLHSLPRNDAPPVVASMTVIPEAPPVSELWSDADQAAMVATYLRDVLRHPNPDDVVRGLVRAL